MKIRTLSAIVLASVLLTIPAGCKKKVPAPPAPDTPRTTTQPPPPAPPPARPGIQTFTAEPSTIDRGQSSTLRWAVEGASEVSVSQGIGAVQGSGTRTVYPSSTTTYTLTAKGPGGTSESTATVNVNVPPPPPPPADNTPKGPSLTLSEWISRNLEDIASGIGHGEVREVRQKVRGKIPAIAAQLRPPPPHIGCSFRR